MPTLEDVIEKVKNRELELPRALALMHRGDDWRLILFPDRMESEEDRNEFLRFAVSVTGEIPTAVTDETGLRVGSYLAATERLDRDSLYGGAIVKIVDYLPLLNNVLCEGIVRGHASHGYEGGWHLMPQQGNASLLELIGSRCWTVMDEEEMLAYAAEKGLEIDEDYLDSR